MSPKRAPGSLLNAHGCDSTQCLAAIGPSPSFLFGCQLEVCLSQPQEGPGLLAMQTSQVPSPSMAPDFKENLSHREFSFTENLSDLREGFRFSLKGLA